MKLIKDKVRKYYKYVNTTIEEATSSDYDFYEDVDVYEAVKENNLYKAVKF